MSHKENDPGNVAAIGRMIRAAGKRVAGYDPDQLARLHELHQAVDDATLFAVRGQRSQGVTWVSIAEALGVTKEAVIQRYGPSGTKVRPVA